MGFTPSAEVKLTHFEVGGGVEREEGRPPRQSVR